MQERWSAPARDRRRAEIHAVQERRPQPDRTKSPLTEMTRSQSPGKRQVIFRSESLSDERSRAILPASLKVRRAASRQTMKSPSLRAMILSRRNLRRSAAMGLLVSLATGAIVLARDRIFVDQWSPTRS